MQKLNFVLGAISLIFLCSQSFAAASSDLSCTAVDGNSKKFEFQIEVKDQPNALSIGLTDQQGAALEYNSDKRRVGKIEVTDPAMLKGDAFTASLSYAGIKASEVAKAVIYTSLAGEGFAFGLTVYLDAQGNQLGKSAFQMQVAGGSMPCQN